MDKCYGYLSYDKKTPVTRETVYDIASVTKTSATTIAIMKLYEQGKIDLNKTLGDYLPWLKESDKATLTLRNILLHQAGFVAWIPFYKNTIEKYYNTHISPYYQKQKNKAFSVQVADSMFMIQQYVDTMMQQIKNSTLGEKDKYVYSDNDFILLGKIVEAVSGQPLDTYTQKHFYKPLHMPSTQYNPLKNGIALKLIAPTENDTLFRHQMLRGYVHDQGAAMLGGVAGHAGLFSNAQDLAKLYHMLLNGGKYKGKRWFEKSTIDTFTSYQSSISRRGLGFDKPIKNKTTAKDFYPGKYVSDATYGHTGFTGTCVWVDPEKDLVYIFLSNRVHPNADNPLLSKMRIREQILDALSEND